jgi:hypothetical protein
MVYLYCLLVCCSCTCTSPHAHTLDSDCKLQGSVQNPGVGSLESESSPSWTLDSGRSLKLPMHLGCFALIYGHRSSCKGARQLVGHKGGVLKRLCDRNLHFMAHRHARCAKCACAADSTSKIQVQTTPAMAADGTPPLQGSYDI